MWIPEIDVRSRILFKLYEHFFWNYDHVESGVEREVLCKKWVERRVHPESGIVHVLQV